MLISDPCGRWWAGEWETSTSSLAVVLLCQLWVFTRGIASCEQSPPSRRACCHFLFLSRCIGGMVHSVLSLCLCPLSGHNGGTAEGLELGFPSPTRLAPAAVTECPPSCPEAAVAKLLHVEGLEI